jgi:hypothetical protein
MALLDREKISEPQDWQTVLSDIRKIIADPQTLPVAKRLLTHIVPLPRSLATLVTQFAGALHPFEADVNVIWGLVDLNIKARRQAIFLSICHY